MKALGALLAIFCIGATVGHTPDAVAADDLVVVTFNVHQWYAEAPEGASNLAAVRDLLRATDADIIVLQETEGARITSQASDAVRWLAWSLGMHHHSGAPMMAQSYNVAVLSRMPLQDPQVVWLPADESIERLALTATVDTARGRILLIATHFQTDIFEVDRERQALAVKAMVRASPLPVILAGDLNTEPGTDPAWTTLRSVLDDHWQGNGNTYSAANPTQRIDHILTSGIAPLEMWVFGGPDASDHRGVAARF